MNGASPAPLRMSALALALLASAGCSRAGDAPAPHILLVVCEGLRADQLEIYGHAAPAAPQLAAFAQHAVVFEHATAASSGTRASIHALLTGRHPSADRRFDDLRPLAASETVLPESLAAAGYETVAISGDPLVSVPLGAGHGFSTFADIGWGSLASPPSPEPEPGARVVVDRAVALLRDRRARPDHGQPLFLFLVVPEDRRADGRSIAALDGELARLLAATAELLADRPLVTVVTADHGQWLGEGNPPRSGSRSGLAPELLHVPLIISCSVSGAGGEPGRVASRVGLIDLAPTLAGLAGAPAAADIDGVALFGEGGLPSSGGGPRIAAPPGRDFIAFRAGAGSGSGSDGGVPGAGELALLRDGWRAERNGESLRLFEESSGDDVTAYRADLLPSMGGAVAHWFARSAQRSRLPGGLAHAGSRPDLSAEATARLEALGYTLR